MEIVKVSLKTVHMKKEVIKPVERNGGIIMVLKPETGKFDCWKENFKKRSKYWELNLYLMNILS
jgi:hypothetical protein